MGVVKRKLKNGRVRYYARVFRGSEKPVYGPARDTRDEAVIDEGNILQDEQRQTKPRTVTWLAKWFKETYPTRPSSRTGELPRDSTVAGLKAAINVFERAFGEQRIDLLERDELKTWASRNAWAMNSLKTMFNEAVDSELIDRSPLRGLHVKGSRGRDPEIEFLTLEEVSALADQALVEHGSYGPTFRAFLIFQAYSCLRPGETFVLERDDLQGDEIMVRRNLGGTGQVTTPKNHKARRVIFPDPAREAIEAMPRVLHSDLVFVTKHGRRLSQGMLGRYWEPVRAGFLAKLDPRRRAELHSEAHPFRCYDLRHFGATYLLNLGVSAGDIAIQLGHEDGGALVNRVYGHPSRKDARERLRKAFNPQPVSSIEVAKGTSQNG